MATLRRLENGQGSGRGGKIFAVVLALLVLGFVASTCYTVDADEKVVVTRFGKFKRLAESGLHFKLPFGFENATPVKTTQRKQEFGFRTEGFTSRTEYSSEDMTRQSLMLTGDLNQAEVQWIVAYEVRDPEQFLFNVSDPEDTLRALSESSMRAVIGDRSITEALTLGKADIEVEAAKTLQEALDLYKSGIKVVRVNLQSVLPPDEVKSSFTAVNDAEQERETMINEALRSYNQSIPAAKGEALQVIQTAEGYKLDRVNRAKGEAERFKSILAEYQKSKDVTKKRMYLEAMADILPKLSRRVIVDENLKGILPMLSLDGVAPGSIPDANKGGN